MRNYWKISTLILGHHTLDKSELINSSGAGNTIEIPIIGLAAEGEGHKVIIDTGHRDAEWVSANILPATTKPEEEMAYAVRKAMGWELDEVDTVINTHLHFDHCGQNYLFKNAQFIVSKSEYDCAMDPPGHQQRLYIRELFGKESVSYFDWRFMGDKDMELYPGMVLLHTPGHTPGHFSVLIRTEEGAVCFAADVCPMIENLEKNKVSNAVTCPEEMLRSYEKIRNVADYYIPGHEPAIKPFQTGDFPAVK